jgi:hypothetical protein
MASIREGKKLNKPSTPSPAAPTDTRTQLMSSLQTDNPTARLKKVEKNLPDSPVSTEKTSDSGTTANPANQPRDMMATLRARLDARHTAMNDTKKFLTPEQRAKKEKEEAEEAAAQKEFED